MSIEIPSPEDYFKCMHTAVEVDRGRVGALREALEPACGWGDMGPLEAFVRAYVPGADAPVRWLDEPSSVYGPLSPAELISACWREGASPTGLGAAGALMARETGKSLLPPPERGRDVRWIEAYLDNYFEVSWASAGEELDSLASVPNIGEWAEELEDWFAEQELSEAEARDCARRTLESWRFDLRARIGSYRRELESIVARGGQVFVWWDEDLGR